MIGVFLGSFDPPHIGHVNVVTAALNSGKVERVIVVPAYKNVWKDTETPYKTRLLMTDTAFENIPSVRVSEIEGDLSRGFPVPSYKTIECLKVAHGDFFIVTTSETYAEIPKWEQGEEIIKNNRFLVVSVSHFDTSCTMRDKDLLIYAPNITICSTNLREKIKNCEIVQPFIQDGVIKIINTLELYK